MNEIQKTGTFAAIAGVLLVLAYATRPLSVTKQEERGGLSAGDLLIKEEATDPSKVASLKITKFDENKLTMGSFELVKDKAQGIWRIPSEFDYPADAEEQLKNALSPLTDLKILDINEDARQSDHALYGVIEPNEKLEAGVTGVGMLVHIGYEADKGGTGLIIGKKIDNSARTQQNLHYVRIPNQDPIYTVDIDPAVFDTNFKKWIKPDLLQVKSFDITKVGIRDYEIERTQKNGSLGAVMSKSMEADATYDTAASKWALSSLVAYSAGQPMPVELAESEELKADKLNSLRTAAQGLQIVGVRPKPKGLAADLKADKTLLDSNESMLSLFDQGFIPQAQGDSTEIYAVAGETLLTTQDGVRYTLRFGEERVANAEIATGDKAELAEGKRERYLLVTASLDDSKFPQPDLQVVPQTIEDLKKMDAEKAAAEAAKNPAPPVPNAPTEAKPEEEPKSADEKPKAESKAEEPKADAPKPEEPKPDEPKADASKADTPKADTPKADTPKADTPKPEEPKPEPPKENTCEAAELNQDAPQGDAPQGDKASDKATDSNAQAGDAPKDAVKPSPDQPPAPTEKSPPKVETEEELKDRLTVVQGDITKANQRLLDARTEKINAARKKVQELNARFADWYYLIEDASFKQLMLKRDALIGPKAAKTDAPAPGGLPNFPSPPNFQLPQ